MCFKSSSSHEYAVSMAGVDQIVQGAMVNRKGRECRRHRMKLGRMHPTPLIGTEVMSRIALGACEVDLNP